MDLRHTVATLSYRAEKVLRDVPDGFPALQAGPTTRTPLQILTHLGDLIEWGHRMALGERRWEHVPCGAWPEAHARFFAGLQALDTALSEAPPDEATQQAIFQGPIADSLTHVGQLAMLRGMAGMPIRPESYARAKIRAGVVGPDQPTERTEFDGDASA